jgi:hypothetical protein
MTIKNDAEPTIAQPASITTSRPMSFLETASYWTGVLAVAATAVAAVSGSFAWYFSQKLSNRKDSDFKTFRESSQRAISEAQARSAEANARAAEANKIAEEERLARVKLEARLAPRSLGEESRNAITTAVKQFAPQQFDVLWYPDDQETGNLANEVFLSLRDAGWVLNRSNSFLGFSLVLGVVIEIAPSKADLLMPASNRAGSGTPARECRR